MKPGNTTEILNVSELSALVSSMRKAGVRDRRMINRLLGTVMAHHPDCLGLWCVFEPDAFDGRDAEFVGRHGHDAEGRFAPRWDRNEGRPRFGRSYGHNSPTLGAWYFIAKDTRQEVVYGPYDEQPLTGLPVLCLSRVAPILERDRFIGAVGVDVSLDSLLETCAAKDASIDHRLEAMLERWHVFLGEDDAIEFASRSARRLLARHIGPCRQGRLPAALGAKLDGHVPAAGPLVFSGVHGELQVTVLTHPYTGMRFLSLEEKRGGRKLAGGGSISAREQEVLDWLQQGKSNGEIALILGISEHTVRHHLERIFGKLGVENRRAAMLCAQQSLRAPEQRFLSHTSPTVLS